MISGLAAGSSLHAQQVPWWGQAEELRNHP